MSRSKKRSKCHRSCRMCAYIRKDKAAAKTRRQLPIEDERAKLAK